MEELEYACDECGLNFETMAELETHNLSEHPTMGGAQGEATAPSDEKAKA